MAMNDYSAYIWGAYGFTLLLMVVVLVSVVWQARATYNRVRVLVTSNLLDNNYETP
jgi:heme exporter protein CcmD